ncbi:MAG: hypothetical protein K0R06_171 [Clostridium sp.]|jgi:hypothetical protein|nr:hypothetical protein [Clostridium sp.]
MTLAEWKFVFPLSLDELSSDVPLLSPAKKSRYNKLYFVFVHFPIISMGIL